MTKIDKKTYHNIRFLLMVSICCIFLMISSTPGCYAQENKNPIVLSFVKANDSIKTSELYFNILKIHNISTKPMNGSVTFNGPENWKIIAFSENETIILPGDSVSIPFRVAPTADALGGITYIINASFKNKERQISTNTYLTLPSKPKWDFTILKNNLYFTENSNFASFEVKLSNKGNTNQLIKLQLKIGKLLIFQNSISEDFTEFITLPAFRDTIITHTVSYQKKLSYAEKSRYENNWKESSIQATASNEMTMRSASIMFHQLNSTFQNQRLESASPLNFDFQTYNIMSDQEPRSNLRVYGSILYPNNRQLDYLLGVQNIYYGAGSNDNFNLDRQLFYSLHYMDNRNNFEIGYNINGGSLHSLNGRGISGYYKLNSKSRISYALIQNPYSLSLGEFVGFSTSFKRLSLSTELTHENSSISRYDATSGMIGTGFTLFKHQSLMLQFLGSQTKFNLTPGKDTTVLGYSYKIDYSVIYKKFELRLSDMNSTHNYIRNSGLSQIYLDSKYLLSDRIALSLYGNHQDYSTSLFPYNFYHPISINGTDYARFTTSISSGNISYQFGPNYTGSERLFYNSITGYKTHYLTYQPGIWAAATFKLSGYRSITPNITVSNLRFYYKTNDPTSQNYSLNQNFDYSLGVNYYDTNWRINAYYSTGSTSDLYRSVQIDAAPVVSSSIQFRPSYENFFFDRKVKLSAYVNYAYYMPSGRENISYNLKYDQFLKHGWVFSVSGFMYSNTVVDQQQGRMETKDLNMVVGISKSFNIQQPRLKYYNFKTVFFNDLDGNHIKSDNEPPVSNVMVNIEKDRSVSSGKSNIPQMDLLSDVNGGISIENLPKDNYKLTFTPLVNLQNLYFLNGESESYYNDKDRTLYVPLAESYRIKGKLIVVRDPNSSDGKIDLLGIRITATGIKGETYSALTDNSGAYVLNVPKADKFKVHVNNVLGENYNIDTDEMEVQFTQNKVINVDFTFIEKTRGVNFDGNELFKFSSIGSSEPEKAGVIEDGQQTQKVPEVIAPSYAIQLGAIKSYRQPAYYKNKFKLKEEVLYLEENGMYKYYTGEFSTLKEAKAQITRMGYSGLLGVAVDRSLLKQGNNVVVPKSPVHSSSGNTSYQPQNSSDENQSSNKVSGVTPNPVEASNTRLEKPADAIEKPVNSLPVNSTNTPVEKPVVVIEKAVNSEPVNSTNTQIEKPAVAIEKPVNSQPVNSTNTPVEKPVNAIEKSANPESINTTNTPVEKQVVASENPLIPQPDKTITQLQKPVAATVKPIINQPVEVDNTKSLKPETVATKDNKSLPVSVKPEIVSQDIQQVSKGITYSVQLDALKRFVDPSTYQMKYKLPDEVLWEEKNGEFRYYAGSYDSEKGADAAISKYGLAGYIVQIDRSKMKKGNTYEKTPTYTIQLEIAKKYQDTNFFKNKYKVKGNVVYFERGDQFIYVTGNYPTLEKAKADMNKQGIKGNIITFDKSLLRSK